MKRRIAVLLVLTIFSTGTIVSLAIGFYATRSLQSTIEKNLTTFHKNLRHRFEAFVIAIRKEEQAVADKLVNQLPRLTKEVLEVNPDPAAIPAETLRTITDQYGFSEFYLINDKGVVVNTTFTPDLGFDLTDINERFAKKLLGLVGAGEVYPDSLVLSSKTGILNIYGYYSPPGSRWIFEVSMNLRDYITRKHGEAYTEYLFHHFFLNAKDEEMPITDLDFYMINDLVAWSIVHEGKKLDEDLRQTIYNKVEHRQVEGNKLVIYSKFSPPRTEGVFNQDYRTKVTLDISHLRDIPTELTLAIGISLFIILPLAYWAASRAMNRALLKPVEQLVQSLEGIGAGDYDNPVTSTGAPEVRKIADVANRMREEILHREEALKDSRDNLEKRVIERTRALERAKEDAEAATRLKDKFISLVSHDIRGPLSSALGLLEVAEDYRLDDGGYGPKTGKILDNARTSLGHLLEMTNRLMDISLLQSGSIRPMKKLHRTFPFVEQIIKRIRHTAELKEITIENRVDHNQEIMLDERLAGDTLLNLISNAIKFTPRGGTITVSSPSPLSLAVQDTGESIPDHLLKNLFRHEVKTTKAGTEGEKGTGLGLPFCKDIMDAHGGSIACESDEAGVTFTMTFPDAKASVIVADHEEEHRRLLKERLAQERQLEVHEAADAQTLLSLAQSLAPALIITETDLPGQDTGSVLEQLRENAETAAIPVLVITDDNALGEQGGSADRRTMALELGISGFLSHPPKEDEVEALIKKYLRANA